MSDLLFVISIPVGLVLAWLAVDWMRASQMKKRLAADPDEHGRRPGMDVIDAANLDQGKLQARYAPRPDRGAGRG